MPFRARHSLAVLASGSLAIGLLAAGCADPEARYDAFLERSATMRARDAGMLGESERFDWSGRYLLAISTTLSPGQPLQFAVDVQVASDLSAADLEFQPLTTEADAEPRAPIGETVRVEGVVYAPDGSFQVDLGEVSVPGRANPISGSDIVARVRLEGRTRPAGEQLPEHFCGRVDGMLIAPLEIDLAGSTFGAVPSSGFAAAPLSRCP